MTRVRRAVLLVVALVLLGALWEGYKAIGGENGGTILGVRVLPRADDISMPHLWQIWERFGQPELSSEGSRSVGVAVLTAMWFTFRVAFAGWLAGTVFGVVLAAVMQRFRTAESALLPYVVVSQTVPLVALAPLVVGWGGHLTVLGRPWQPWMSVATIAAYLAFFPVAVGTLRGLQSPTTVQVGLLHCYAASWWQSLMRLRMPACVPYLLPALRLAATASVIGAIVAEISTGTRGGIGRLIIEYAQSATGDPAKPFAAIIGAAVLGMVAAGSVGAVERALRRFRPAEGAE